LSAADNVEIGVVVESSLNRRFRDWQKPSIIHHPSIREVHPSVVYYGFDDNDIVPGAIGIRKEGDYYLVVDGANILGCQSGSKKIKSRVQSISVATWPYCQT
jgi:hypothetical protein